MSYKLIVLAVSAATGLTVCASAAMADEPAPTSVEIVATAADPGGGDGGPEAGGGDAGDDDGCTPWEVNIRELPVEDMTVNVDLTGDIPVRDPDGFVAAASQSPDGTASLLRRECGGIPEFTWVPGGQEPVVTVDDLWPGAYDEARNRIPLPDVAPLAPPVFQGTLVNAPLWLAVAPPDPVSARAEAGAVWAQVDATFVGLTWDLGVPGTDDDVIECDGPGDPWTGEPPVWAEEQWPTPPCGFNYEQPSTPEHTGNGNFWYDVTVTAHWDVQLTGSDGRDVALDPIDRMFEFQYVVYEWQTVGTG